MKKLEDIEKKNIFKAPDRYFETLPGIVQSRITAKNETWSSSFSFGLKYALPVLIIMVGLIWYFKSPSSPEANPENLLALVSSEDIADYLNSMEISNDDFLESLDYTQINADSLDLYESDIFSDDSDYSDILNELKSEIKTGDHE